MTRWQTTQPHPAVCAPGRQVRNPSVLLAGGGIAGGQAYGATTDDGMEVADGRIDQQDLLATLCRALEVDPATENTAEGGRPVPIAEGTPVSEVLSL